MYLFQVEHPDDWKGHYLHLVHCAWCRIKEKKKGNIQFVKVKFGYSCQSL